MVLEYLTKLSEVSLIILLSTLLISAIAFIFRKHTNYKISSFEPILLVITVTAIAHVIWEWFLTPYFYIQSSPTKELVRLGWYVGFATTDWLAVIVSVLWVRHLNLPPGRFSNHLLIIFSLLGVLQLARYADLYFFDLDFLRVIYRNSPPTCSSIITVMAIIEVGGKLFQFRRRGEGV